MAGRTTAGRLRSRGRPVSGSMDGVVVGFGGLGAHGRRGQRGPVVAGESELRIESIAKPLRIVDALCCGAKYVAVIQITAF